ncbi:hypothetical protein AB0K15_13865 [Amycolatopsis sp. NPDC049253]|uniref:hypothetical protein n=1 Tax=Amycolatopsis sp. NPDC049253 TaxID=3155274 RepID=UPI00342520D0
MFAGEFFGSGDGVLDTGDGVGGLSDGFADDTGPGGKLVDADHEVAVSGVRIVCGWAGPVRDRGHLAEVATGVGEGLEPLLCGLEDFVELAGVPAFDVGHADHYCGPRILPARLTAVCAEWSLAW